MLLNKFNKKQNRIQKKLNLLNHNIFIKDIKKFYFPIINKINNYHFNDILKIGISGAQGCGKTTFAKILKILIESLINKNVLILSIDDFYLTKKERIILSEKIHPLLITRGVPGTHDVNLLIKTIKNIQSKSNYKVAIPLFNKLLDDRLQKNKKTIKKPDIILLEGWCINASPIPLKLLNNSINILEKRFDNKNSWREYYNCNLKKLYKDLFDLLDYSIYLKIPNYNKVFEWRKMQEKKNMKKQNIKNFEIEDDKLKIFIMHYEKLTKWMLKDMPQKTDVCLNIGNNHRFSGILFNRSI